MSDGPVQVDSGPARSPWFLPVAILAMALLLVAIALSEDSVAPIDLADDPGPIVDFETDSVIDTQPQSTPAAAATRGLARAPLRELVPGFDGTLHLWVSTGDGDQLLVWSDPLAAPRPMDLPDGTSRVDLNTERLKTLVVTENRNGHGVLWLGDRNHVEPTMIFDTPIDARWHASRPDQLAVSQSAEDQTIVVVYDVEPGNVLVEAVRLEAVPGRAVDWVGDAGVSLRALGGQPVVEWLTYDGESITFSRHLTQPGGRPIFDICTGVPCRPTLRLFVDDAGTLTRIGPEVVQVTDDGVWQLVLGADGPGVRPTDDVVVTHIPISGLNAWSSDGRWMVFEQEASLVETNQADGMIAATVRHPIGFLRLDGKDLYEVNADVGQIEGIWLP